VFGIFSENSTSSFVLVIFCLKFTQLQQAATRCMQASYEISNKSYMKYIKNYFLIFTLFINFNSLAQSDKFNLSFEEYENNNFSNWNVDKQLGFTADSIFKIEGKNSLKLKNDKFEGEKTIKLTNNIPFTYEGNNLKFQGYIKTEEVKNGNVFLYVIVEDETNQFYFDMSKTFDGTKEWKSLKLIFHIQTNQQEFQ